MLIIKKTWFILVCWSFHAKSDQNLIYRTALVSERPNDQYIFIYLNMITFYHMFLFLYLATLLFLYLVADYRISASTVLCYCCGQRTFKELAYRFWQNIPASELPGTRVHLRPPCACQCEAVLPHPSENACLPAMAILWYIYILLGHWYYGLVFHGVKNSVWGRGFKTM